ARQDRANSGHRAGPRQVDRYDPRVRKRTRDIRGVEHARANDVRRKTGRAGDLVAPLDPVLGLPEDRRRRLGDAGHRITLRARQSAKSCMSWSALRLMTAWPNSPMRP